MNEEYTRGYGYAVGWHEYVNHTPYIERVIRLLPKSPNMFHERIMDTMLGRRDLRELDEQVRKFSIMITKEARKQRVVPFFTQGEAIVLALDWFYNAYRKYFKKAPYGQFLYYMHEVRHRSLWCWYGDEPHISYPHALGFDHD